MIHMSRKIGWMAAWLVMTVLRLTPTVATLPPSRDVSDTRKQQLQTSKPNTSQIDPPASNDITEMAGSNRECIDAEPIAGEGFFRFDNSGPVTADPPSDLVSCSNPFGLQYLSDIWYCWTATCDGPVTIDTCGATAVDTKIAIYDGCDCLSLNDRLVICDDDGCSYQSNVTFTAAVGQSYLIRLATSPKNFIVGGEGEFAITCGDRHQTTCSQFTEGSGKQRPNPTDALLSDGVQYAVAEDFTPEIDTQISELCWWGTYFDESSDCRSEVNDGFEIRYYEDDDGQPGAMIGRPFRQSDGSLTVVGPVRTYQRVMDDLWEYAYSAVHEPVSVSAGGCYWIQIVNRIANDQCHWYWEVSDFGSGRVFQDGLRDGRINGYSANESVSKDMSLSFNAPISFLTRCPSPQSNDECASAVPIAEGETFFDTNGATTDGLESPRFCFADPNCCHFPLGGRQIHRDIWFDYTASCSGNLILDLCDTDYDSKVAIYSGNACPTTGESIACNDDDCGNALALGSQVTLPVTQGESFKIRIGGSGREGSGFDNCNAVDPTGDECFGITGTGTIRLSCVEAPPADRCADTEVASLPHAYTGTTVGASGGCELIPGRYTWIAFELCEAAAVTLSYTLSESPTAAIFPRLARDCPCEQLTQPARIEFSQLGLAVLTWNCLLPGVYYYPVLAESGAEGAYAISAASDACLGLCGSSTGSCCAKHSSTGCSDPTCCETVCAIDSVCCNDSWDTICVQQASLLCSTCLGNPCGGALGDCFEPQVNAGCNDADICETICACDPYCCAVAWDEFCAGEGVRDRCGASADCDTDGVLDRIEIDSGNSIDCNLNHIPDECEPDCNANLQADQCDLDGCVSLDCNENGVPDECDLATMTSTDCNFNSQPDECDIRSGLSTDCDSNDIPDECETENDCNKNLIPDQCEAQPPGYQNNNPHGQQFVTGYFNWFADDVQRTAAECNLVGYDIGVRGIDSASSGELLIDLRSRLVDEDRNFGGLFLNTRNSVIVEGDAYRVLHFHVDPPIQLPQDFFVAFRASRPTIGPIHTCQQPQLGFTEPTFFLYSESQGRWELRLWPDCPTGIDLTIWCETPLDCNHNLNPDDCDIEDEVSSDCNLTGIPDECERADYTGDGIIDVSDAVGFATCLTGPCGPVPCAPALYGNRCCVIGDIDADGDVDMRDWAEYQRGLSIR